MRSFAIETGRLRAQQPKASSNQSEVGAVTQASGSDQTKESPDQSEMKSLRGAQWQIQERTHVRCQACLCQGHAIMGTKQTPGLRKTKAGGPGTLTLKRAGIPELLRKELSFRDTVGLQKNSLQLG